MKACKTVSGYYTGVSPHHGPASPQSCTWIEDVRIHLPFGIFRCFVHLMLTWDGFLHKPRGLLPCSRKETHMLDLGSIFPDAAKVVSFYLTEITPTAEAPGPEGGSCTPHQAHSVSRRQSPR